MSKSNKYSLLEKKEKEKYPEKQEWIQMENLSFSDTNRNNENVENSQIKYQKLKQEQIPVNNNKKTQPVNLNPQLSPQNQTQSQKKYPTYQQSTNPQNYQNQNSQIKRPTNQSTYINPYQNIRNRPVNSSNIQINNSQVPRNTNMNSRHPQQNRSLMPQQNKPSIPPMTVNCQKCTFSQSVPGNCQVYICCMCNQMNECFPLYGIFVCGVCHINVVYPFGTSQFVKCTRCQTINRVPFQPQKSYKSGINQKSRPTQKISNNSTSSMRRNQYDQEQIINVKKIQQRKQMPFQKKQNTQKIIIKQKEIQVKPQKKVEIKQKQKNENLLSELSQTQNIPKNKKVQKQERILDQQDNIRTFKVQDDIFNQAHHQKTKQEQILFEDFDINLVNGNKNQKSQKNQNGYPTFFD